MATEQKVLKTIKENEMIESGDRIVLGVSGGPDSVCMLDILYKLSQKMNFNIYVAHINHMIRENALLDEKFVKIFCDEKGIPIYIKRIDVRSISKQKKIGLEEAGRFARYDFFDEVLRLTKSNKIATAHNLNDNAETIMMNILRGSGSLGLKGIEKKKNNKYIRPIIELEREEIENYCEENKLNPRIDESNGQNLYTRNKIRNICIPFIKNEFNPNIIKTLNRLSEIIGDETEYILRVVQNKYTRIFENKSDKEIILNLKEFNNLDLVIKRRLILYTINELLGTTNGIEKVNIDDIVKLCNNNIGNKFLSPIKGLKIMINNKKLRFLKY